MTEHWYEKLTGPLEDKRQYREFKRRTKELPPSYRQAVEAYERYLMYFGSITRGDVLVRMVTDLLDLFEQSAAAGTPVRDVVGEDPVEFAEDFIRSYSEGQWINKERTRLIESIARAERAGS